ncbi:putative Ig domain-containing protein [Gemmatimonadota bacterium]
MVLKLRLFSVIGVLAITCLSLSCGDSSGGTTEPEAPRATSVTVTPSTATLEILGATIQLSVQVRDQHGQVMSGASASWNSSAPGVASVSTSGLVTAVSVGSTTITAASGSASGSAVVTVDVPPPSIVTTSLPDGIVGTAYSQTLSATGGSGTYQWSIVNEAPLPAGLGLASSTGVISGIPTTVGTTDFQVEVTSNEQADTSSLSISVTFPPLEITTTTLPEGSAGVAYDQMVVASGGGGAYTWSISSGALPTGLSLADSTGIISGTPTVGGTFDFDIQVASGDGQTATKSLSILIHGPLGITTTALPSGSVGVAYDQTLAASGGEGGYTWSIIAGALPTGLSLVESTAAISGTPTAAGTFDFDVQVSSSDGQTASKSLSILIRGILEIKTVSLPDGHLGVAYSRTLKAQGGDSVYTWSISAGALPVGLSLAASTGSITGTPTELGTFDFDVQVTSGDGQTAARPLSITVDDAGAYDCSAQSEIPVQECQALVALYNSSNGEEWSNSTGWLESTTPCNWLGVSCVDGSVGGIDISMNNMTGHITAELGKLSNLTKLSFYSNLLTGPIPAELGNLSKLQDLTLSLNLLSGSLPAELGYLSVLKTLTLESNQLTGPIPAEYGNLSNLLWLRLSRNRLSGPIPIELGALSDVWVFWLQENELSGLVPLQVARAGGIVQDGHGSSRCQLSSNPGLYLLDTQDYRDADLDNDGYLCDLPLSPVLTITTSSLPDGQMGATYSEPLVAAGGDSNYTWSVSAGALPDGLSLTASSGLISGTPTGPGFWGFTVQVVSGEGQIATAHLSIKIAGLSTFDCLMQSEIPQTECQALVDLYGDTNGAGWTNSTGWLENTTPCSWHGVSCTGGSVSSIDLSSNQLTGSIPGEIEFVPNLDRLELDRNQLYGRIPTNLGALVKLTSLDLSVNQLTGPIPSELGNLSSLTILKLFDNQISGPIPDVLGNLSTLNELLLYDNELSGPIPAVIGNLSNLRRLNLHLNQLTGPIPAELGNLSNLSVFWLHENQLAGLIPLEVAQRGGGWSSPATGIMDVDSRTT